MKYIKTVFLISLLGVMKMVSAQRTCDSLIEETTSFNQIFIDTTEMITFYSDSLVTIKVKISDIYANSHDLKLHRKQINKRIKEILNSDNLAYKEASYFSPYSKPLLCILLNEGKCLIRTKDNRLVKQVNRITYRGKDCLFRSRYVFDVNSYIERAISF